MNRRQLVLGLTAASVSPLIPSLARAQARDLRDRAITADEVGRALYLDPAEPAAPVAEPAAIIVDIQFDINSASLRPGVQQHLDVVAEALTRTGSRPALIRLEGHTDVSGPWRYNHALSKARAVSVRNYLALRGVPRDRLIAQGFGPERLLPGLRPNHPRHRRVEIHNIT